jgi:YHS domain-containing protein
MKYLFALPLLLLIACGQNNTHHSDDAHNLDAHVGSIDPVCNMIKDETWTEYTVNNTDTVWFCSEYCKDAYVANPQKFLKEDI